MKQRRWVSRYGLLETVLLYRANKQTYIHAETFYNSTDGYVLPSIYRYCELTVTTDECMPSITNLGLLLLSPEIQSCAIKPTNGTRPS